MKHIFFVSLVVSFVSAYTSSIAPPWMLLQHQHNMKWSIINTLGLPAKRHVPACVDFYTRGSAWRSKIFNQHGKFDRDASDDFIRTIHTTRVLQGNAWCSKIINQRGGFDEEASDDFIRTINPTRVLQGNAWRSKNRKQRGKFDRDASDDFIRTINPTRFLLGDAWRSKILKRHREFYEEASHDFIKVINATRFLRGDVSQHPNATRQQTPRAYRIHRES